MRKTIFFYIFVPSDLDLWPSELKLTPTVTLVLRYVSTKLEVSTASLLDARDGRTERRGAALNAVPSGGPRNNTAHFETANDVANQTTKNKPKCTANVQVCATF